MSRTMNLCKDCRHLFRYEEQHRSLPSAEVYYQCLHPELAKTNPVTGGRLPADPFMENEDCNCIYWRSNEVP